MAIQECERCGADLPPTAPGATVTCSYCGVEQRLSMVPPPVSPTRAGLPAIARVDPMRARTLFELFLREIQRDSGVDVRREGQAVERLVRAAAQSVGELDATGVSIVNLPFITATGSGPIHYERRLTRADLEAVPAGGAAGNPFAAPRSARYATQEDIAAEIQSREAARGASSSAGCIVTAAILMFVGVAGAVAFFASSGGNGAATPDVVAAVADIAPAVVPPKTPADADRDDAWVSLPASRLAGDLHSVDGVAQLPWAIGTAREWAPDASLESFYANGIRVDGTCDLSDHEDGESHEPNLDYRFVSAARRAQAAQRIQVAENDVRSSFRIWIHDGVIAVMSDVERGDDLEDRIATPLEPQPDCNLAGVLGAMRERGLAIRPKYDLTTTWDEDDGKWSWWIDMTDVGDDLPRVDATTCRVRR